MQEKDIKKKLNQELDEMAPDIFSNILSQAMEPVKSEKELFGKDKPLFKEKKKVRQFVWAPALAAVAACIALVVLYVLPTLFPISNQNSTGFAFSITVDVNPSISIQINKDGKVADIIAENKDAKPIVKAAKNKIDENTKYNKALKIVIRQLNKKKYLKKDKSAMLVSVVSDDKGLGKEKLEEIKNTTKKVKKNKNIKCKTVYQNCKKTDELEKVAKKNNVSVGKAAFCMKLAKKENISVKKMCKENIYTLVETAELEGTEGLDEIVFDEEIPTDIESVSETESILETGVYGETESIEAITANANELESVSELSTDEQVIVPESKAGN